jgi:hypothetical protein
MMTDERRKKDRIDPSFVNLHLHRGPFPVFVDDSSVSASSSGETMDQHALHNCPERIKNGFTATDVTFDADIRFRYTYQNVKYVSEWYSFSRGLSADRTPSAVLSLLPIIPNRVKAGS